MSDALDAERYRRRRDEEWLQLSRSLPAGHSTDRDQHARSYDAYSDWLTPLPGRHVPSATAVLKMPSTSEIKLACGELTSGEVRTVKAALVWFISKNSPLPAEAGEKK